MRKNIALLECTLIWFVTTLLIQNCSKLREGGEVLPPDCSASACHLYTSLKNYPPISGKHQAHLKKGFECSMCHNNYNNNSIHKNGMNDTINGNIIVFFDSFNKDASWNDPATSCENMTCHGTANWYSTEPLTCTQCHYSGSAIDPVTINGSGTEGKHQKHVTEGGIDCEKCHFNYRNSSTHQNDTLDTDDSSVLITLFDSTNPSGSWTGDTGANTGSCGSLACHGSSTLDWYGTNTWVLPGCDSCHGAAIGTRRQVTGAGGDFAGNPSIISNHVAGGTDPGKNQCKVCHEMSLHMGGTLHLRDADKDTPMVYDPSDNSSLEPFCLSCHDSDGAISTYIAGGSAGSPFNDGENLGTPPYPYSKRIATSWIQAYGHGPNGGHGEGEKLTCLGTGEPGTGCHGNNGNINAHGSSWQVIGAKEFKYDLQNSYSESHFDLCFNCHAGYPGVTKEDTFGVKSGGTFDHAYGPPGGPNGNNPPYYTAGTTTHFADRGDTGSALFYDDSFWGDQMNLHWMHICILASDFRGTGTNSGITCVNCHDVHGSSTEYGAAYWEIGYINGPGSGSDIYGKMNDAFLGNSSPYPAYCGGFACHDVFTDPTHAWFYPMIE